MVWSLPASSVHGIFQAKVLEWVALSFRKSSWPRDQTHVSCISCISCMGRLVLYQLNHYGSPYALYMSILFLCVHICYAYCVHMLCLLCLCTYLCLYVFMLCMSVYYSCVYACYACVFICVFHVCLYVFICVVYVCVLYMYTCVYVYIYVYTYFSDSAIDDSAHKDFPGLGHIPF